MTFCFNENFTVIVSNDYIITSEKSDRPGLYKSKLLHRIGNWNPRFFEEMPLEKSIEWAILMARLWPLDWQGVPYIAVCGDKPITSSWEFLELFNLPFTHNFEGSKISDFPGVSGWKHEDVLILGNIFRVYQP